LASERTTTIFIFYNNNNVKKIKTQINNKQNSSLTITQTKFIWQQILNITTTTITAATNFNLKSQILTSSLSKSTSSLSSQIQYTRISSSFLGQAPPFLLPLPITSAPTTDPLTLSFKSTEHHHYCLGFDLQRLNLLVIYMYSSNNLILQFEV